jgi:hypothetical protein
MSRKNPLAHIFADENDPPAAVNATAAAKAYGLGLNISGTARPNQARPQISIPNLGDDSDNEDASLTMRTTKPRSRPAVTEPLTLRAPSAHATLSPPSSCSSSPPPRRRPSTPPPPSPSLRTPTEFKFGSGSTARDDPPQTPPVSSSPSMPSMLLRNSPPSHLARSRANTAPSQDYLNDNLAGPLTSSPPSTRPLIRRGRSGTGSSADAVPPLPLHTRKVCRASPRRLCD